MYLVHNIEDIKESYLWVSLYKGVHGTYTAFGCSIRIWGRYWEIFSITQLWDRGWGSCASVYCWGSKLFISLPSDSVGFICWNIQKSSLLHTYQVNQKSFKSTRIKFVNFTYIVLRVSKIEMFFFKMRGKKAILVHCT